MRKIIYALGCFSSKAWKALSRVKSFFPVVTIPYPLLRAVMIQSAQKRCKHSFVVMVFFNISRQMGHMSSLCRLLGDTTISKPSVIAS